MNEKIHKQEQEIKMAQQEVRNDLTQQIDENAKNHEEKICRMRTEMNSNWEKEKEERTSEDIRLESLIEENKRTIESEVKDMKVLVNSENEWVTGEIAKVRNERVVFDKEIEKKLSRIRNGHSACSGEAGINSLLKEIKWLIFTGRGFNNLEFLKLVQK